MSQESSGWRGWLPYGLAALAVWLAWEVAKPVLADRAPVNMAVAVAPSSPTALRRAAESELSDGRIDNAAELARAALRQRPFDARSVRVLGLAQARAGRVAEADDLLTLAGNWSLRDDPAHAWLIQQRLRQGNYYSAFAHADTLIRRRSETYDGVFNLYATAGLTDPRAISPLTRLIADNPPWRRYFFNYLYFTRPAAAPLAGALAIQLQETSGHLTDEELGLLYGVWLSQSRFEGVEYLRSALARPPLSGGVSNGDFSIPFTGQILPFGWSSEPAAGLNIAILDRSDDAQNKALFIDYNGYSNHIIMSQVLTLEPGRHTLAADVMVERGGSVGFVWRFACLGSEAPTSILRTGVQAEKDWVAFNGALVVPAEKCPLQGLELVSGLSDGRASVVAWFDNIRIVE